MKNIIFFSLLSLLLFTACEEEMVVPASQYACKTPTDFNADRHPLAAELQEHLVTARREGNGQVGSALLIHNQDGIWANAVGKADLANDVDFQVCNRFFVASISKIFTATVIHKLVEEGVLDLNKTPADYLDKSIIDKVSNGNTATLRNLLAHRSGIPDYYIANYELARINRPYNEWTAMETLEFIYGKSADFAPGETYGYSNTNFLLLGIIAKAASGKDVETLYKEFIFNPLNLESAYYSESDPVPADVVRGYLDVHGNGRFSEVDFLSHDELVTADGGMAINMFDLNTFIRTLMKGELLNSESMAAMTDYLELPEDWQEGTPRLQKNGLGLEYFTTPYGDAVGHTGYIDSYASQVYYFLEQDVTFIHFQNSGGADSGRKTLTEAVLRTLFE
ncbi:MAG: serine hydrolase domain-containing protein [Saprospiraceae bacterium]